MVFIHLSLFMICGFLISLGLVLRTEGMLKKVVEKKSKGLFLGMLCRVGGAVLLAYLLFKFKTQDLALNLTVFFLASALTIGGYLLACRTSIR